MRAFFCKRRTLLTLLLVALTGCSTVARSENTISTTPTTIQATATPAPLLTTPTPQTPMATDSMEGMSSMSGMGGMDSPTVEVTSAPHPGDPVQGKMLFDNGIGNAAVPVCSSCHIVDSDKVKVGPSLQHVATHAQMHANEHHVDLWTFLRTSITNPNDDIMEAVSPQVFAVNGVSLMYQNYAKDLTETQINDLVAYLMTLK